MTDPETIVAVFATHDAAAVALRKMAEVASRWAGELLKATGPMQLDRHAEAQSPPARAA